MADDSQNEPLTFQSFVPSGSPAPAGNSSAEPVQGALTAPELQTNSAAQAEADKAQAFENQNRHEFGDTLFGSHVLAAAAEATPDVLQSARWLFTDKPDPNYVFDPSSKDGQDIARGLSDENIKYLVNHAMSPEHAKYLAQEAWMTQQAQSNYESFDPIQKLGYSLTPGNADGLLNVPNLLPLALPGGAEARMASRIGRFLLGGARDAAAVAAGNAVFGSPTSGHDITDGVLGMFLLGGAMHGIMPPEAVNELSDAAANLRRSNAATELNGLVDRGVLSPEQVEQGMRDTMDRARKIETANENFEYAQAQANQLHNELDDHLANETMRLLGESTGNEELVANTDVGKVSSQIEELRAARDEHTRVLSGDQDQQIEREIDRLTSTRSDLPSRAPSEDAERVNVSARERARAEATETVVGQRKTAAAAAEEASSQMQVLQGQIDRLNNARSAEADLERIQGLAQKPEATLADKVEALPEAIQGRYAARAAEAERDLRAARKARQDLMKPVEAPPASQPGAGSFGEDSASAARVDNTEVNTQADFGPNGEKYEEVPQEYVPFFQKVPLLREAFKTFSSVLRGSADAVVRSRLGRLVGSAIGNIQGSAITRGGTDFMQMMSHAWHGQIARIENEFKGQWLAEQGMNPALSWSRPAIQKQWEEAVGKEIRGIDTGSQVAKQAAAPLREFTAMVLQEAKRAGVNGLEDVEINPHYLPRIFNKDTADEIRKALGPKGMVQFLADAMEKTGNFPGLDRDNLETIARGYDMTMRRLIDGVDGYMMHGPTMKDLDYLQNMLTESGLPAAQVNRAMRQLEQLTAEQGEGAVRYTKSRLTLDETHTVNIGGKDVAIGDLYRNDAFTLLERYARTMAGVTAAAKVGYKSEGDFAKAMTEALTSLSEEGATKESMAEVKSYGEAAWKLLLGRPLDNDSFQLAQQFGTVMRNYASARSMGQSGFSVANNLIRPWTNGYASYTNKYLSSFGDMLRRGENGFDLPLLKDLERYTGLGTDYVNSRIWSHFEGDTALTGVVNNLNTAMKAASKATYTLSGMTPGLVAGNRFMGVAILDRIVRNAFGEIDLPAYRLSQMGLDSDMLDRIASEVRKNASTVENTPGNPIRDLNLPQFDPDVRDALMTAVTTEAKVLIHGEDVAATSLWMNKGLGRFIIQMRRFPMMAMSKQLGRAMLHPDMQTLGDFAATSAVGALSAAAQVYVKSFALSDDERDKYFEQNLDPERLIMSGLQRNPYSAMVPQLVDTAATHAGLNPVFDQRASGQSGDVLQSPITDAIGNISKVLSDPIKKGGFDRAEWSNIVRAAPLGNTMPMAWMTNALADKFPKTIEQQRRTDEEKKPLSLQALDSISN